jgi:hypothetical protein
MGRHADRAVPGAGALRPTGLPRCARPAPQGQEKRLGEQEALGEGKYRGCGCKAAYGLPTWFVAMLRKNRIAKGLAPWLTMTRKLRVARRVAEQRISAPFRELVLLRKMLAKVLARSDSTR